MKRITAWLFAACIAFACTEEKTVHITVGNPSSFDRSGELIEIATETLKGLPDEGPFIIADDKGKQVPCQLTYDKKVIFPVSLPAKATAGFILKAGRPEVYDTLVCGRAYPERLDDIAWENNRIAFRLYGPALQASGERAFGYDVWVKNVAEPVVEERYYQELVHGVSYHTDHGNGLDYYNVGPTLGAGASALMANDTLVYPYCYKTYEILDNGPLRFTVKLTYNPLRIGNDEHVIETRLLSLDAGSQLNKVTLSFRGLSRKTPLATGIVMHQGSKDYLADASEGFIAYADPADPLNGQLYIGAIFPSSVKETRVAYFSDREKAERRAEGHVLSMSDYTPDTDFTYYWGGGWSKWGFPTSTDWFGYIRSFSHKVNRPLVVEIH
ncbi:MAG: DUF4861 domain-containing protein [Tannerellaceae bacterium]|jgi:hypothetical protein|nr:DUF4861 domain-containing protein [Tannerellaceae bacterium]